MKIKRLLYVFLIGILLSSCGGSDESDVIIIAKTINTKDFYEAGDKIIFDIESFANEGFVTSINISTITSSGYNKIFDTLINYERTKFIYQYEVPQFDNDTTKLTFKFTALCSTGNYSEMSKTHNIVGDIHLTPLEYTMFASYKNEKNGFSIERNEIVDCETTDSLYVDFYDYSIDSTFVLSREWRSMNGLLFARFNDFDFENANYSSVINAYKNSNKSTKLLNVSNEDIILVGRNNDALGVLKVVNVFDDADPMQDRYYFVFKGLR